MKLVVEPIEMTGEEITQYVEDTRLYKWVIAEGKKHSIDLSIVDMDILLPIVRRRIEAKQDEANS